MKNTILLLFALLSSLSFAQINTVISGNVFNGQVDEVVLARFNGKTFNDIKSAKIKKDGNFKLEAEVAHPDYYVLRIGDQNVNLIIRSSQEIKIYGDGNNLSQFLNIVGSEESSNMQRYLQIMKDWQAKSDAATAAMKADPTKKDQINRDMASEYQKFQGQTKSFIARNRNSAALYAAISSVDPVADFTTYESIVKQLVQSFPSSPSIQDLEKRYQAYKKQKEANDILAPGKMAPDFEEALPDGTTMKLSDLKGKVVLLDFWASWCGPCRRENPNVVALYNKYKDKGFTVMSVSLDKDKKRWLDAIEKDKLTWPYHVSDLKYWQSKAAQLYGVRGIPFTVLIDQEGKIIGTKLRGEGLTQAVSNLLDK